MNAAQAIDDLVDEFSFLDAWEDRYRHVIDIGRGLDGVRDEERNEANRVQGCVSRVWLVTDILDGDPVRLSFRGDSDAHIVKGLVGVIARLFSDRTPEDILAVDAREVFNRLGLSEHLSQQRSNGLNSLIARVRADAEAAHGKP